MQNQRDIDGLIELDQARFRPSEVPVFIGSGEKIRRAVGWRPARDFAESLRETLDWWRGKVSVGDGSKAPSRKDGAYNAPI